MRRLLPEPGPVSDLYAEYEVPEAPLAGRGWHVRVNFVASADGAVTLGGLSRGLSTAPDHAVFSALRDLADVVLVGAGTVRAEGYRPLVLDERRRAVRRERGLAEVPVLAVVSGRLRLDPAADFFTAERARTLVLTHGRAPARERAALAGVTEVVDAGTERVDPMGVVRALADRGLRRILCEGGPHLFAAMLGAGAVDELCLTVSPLLTGPGAGRIVAGGYRVDPTGLRLRRLLEEDGSLLARYQVSG